MLPFVSAGFSPRAFPGGMTAIQMSSATRGVPSAPISLQPRSGAVTLLVSVSDMGDTLVEHI